MAVYFKAVTANDIVAGLATVCTGQKTATYDNRDRTIHQASGESLSLIQNQDRRYHYHGGVGGSGNWEH